MRLTVRTRSCNPELYEKMRSFIPESVECIAHTAYDDWTGAATFLHDAIDMTDGMLLICDEDAFITQWSAVQWLATHLSHSNFIFCGVPDGATIPHRSWSFISANPSFVIFDCDKIKKAKGELSWDEIDKFDFDPSMDRYKPYFLTGNYNHGHGEPFNGLFYWLVTIGVPLYLNGETLGDGLTTAIKGAHGQTICYHSWMSRDKSESNQARIQKIYELALKQKL